MKKKCERSCGTIANEVLTLSFAVFEQESAKDVRIQRPCVTSMLGTLMACRSLGKTDYEGLIMSVSKFAAKMSKQPEQCEMVTRCSHLFYVLDHDGSTVVYANPQRSLELQDLPHLQPLKVCSLDLSLEIFQELEGS